MTDTHRLLADYAEDRSEAAFRELVSRYIDFVHSSAVRLVGGDRHLAGDVTQTVFIHLARNAHKLKGNVMLGGWLHRDVCNVASKVLRAERRRRCRERQAMEMIMQDDHSKARLEEITPILDEAVNQLGDEDRTAILLRFFEQLEFRLVGEALGTSEEAARKRVSRALEKLQSRLKVRGISFSAAVLGTVLTKQAVSAAPVGFSSIVSSKALACASAGAGATSGLLKLTTVGGVKLGLAATLGIVAVILALASDQGGDSQGYKAAALQVSGSLQAPGKTALTNGDSVAAIVNGTAILLSEVRARFEAARRVIERQYAAQPGPMRQKRREFWIEQVDSLINLELVVEDFDRRGLQLSENEARLATNTLLRRKLILGKMRLQELANLQKPSQAEVQEYYNSHQREFWQEPRVYFAQTVFKKSRAVDGAGVETGSEVTRKEAVAFREKLLSGDTDSLASMGEAKWYEVSVLRPELARVIASVDAAGWSDVVEAPDSFYILRVLEKEDARQKTFAETAMQISKSLAKHRLDAAEKEWYDTLRSKAVIKRAPLPPEL